MVARVQRQETVVVCRPSMFWYRNKDKKPDIKPRTAVVWCGVVWYGVVWFGFVWCGVVCRGVVWCVAMVCAFRNPPKKTKKNK